RPVQRIAHFEPWIVIAGHQQIANLRLEPLHALLGRARAQIPIAVRFVTVRPKRVAQEVEAFLPGIPQRSLGFIECQPKPCHRSPRPRQGLSRTSTAEDDEVVGIRDDVRSERFPAPGQPPVLQEPVHVDVGKQWARDAALRRAARAALATTDAPGPVARSAAQRRPLSRGSSPSGYPAEPLVSFRINRQLSGWNLPPLMIRSFGAHCQSRTSRVNPLGGVLVRAQEHRAECYLNNSGRGSGMKPLRLGISTRGRVCASSTVALSMILASERM